MLPGEQEYNDEQSAAVAARPSVADILVGGKPATVPESDLQAALSAGATLPAPSEDDGGVLGDLKAGEIAFGSALGGGLIPGAIHNVAKRVDPAWAEGWKQNYEAALKDADKHPIAKVLGSGAAFGADMLGPIGKIGGAIGSATKGGGLALRLGGAAAGNVATMAAYNVGEQVTQNELDPEEHLASDPGNFEKIFSAAGKDLLLNATVGASLHGAGELFGAARRGGKGLLSSLPRSPGPASNEIADQVAGVALSGEGVRAEAKQASSFLDTMTKAGATREQAAEAWQKLGSEARSPESFTGDGLRSVADWMADRHISANPAIKEAMAKGAAERAMSATEGEAFRVAQINKFMEAGNTALRDGVDINNDLAFGLKKEQVRKTISGAFADHLDAANAIGQDADGFLQRWAADETHGGLNFKDATKMVDRYKREVSTIAGRVGEAANDSAEASAQIFQAADNLKRNFGQLKKMKGPSGFGAAPFVHDLTAEIHGGPGATNYGARAVYERIQKTLEDSKIFGQAGELQAAINAPFAAGITNEGSALGKLTVALKSEGWDKIPEIHSAKAASFLDSAGSIEGKTDTQSLYDVIDNHIARANNLIQHAALEPAELAAAERAKVVMEQWRSVVKETTERSAANARIQRLVKDEGPGLGHGLLGKLADPLMRPLHNQMALEHFARTADSVTNGIKKAVGSVMGWSSKGAAKTAGYAERAAKEIEGVRAAAASPEVMAARVSEFVGDDTHKAVPQMAAGVASVAARAVSFLASKAPQGYQPGGLLPGKQPRRFSDMELSAWERQSSVVKDPIGTVAAAKEGHLTREGVEALKFVYPNMYNELRQYAQDQLTDMDKTGKLDQMPYDQKCMLGLMLGITADDTMAPDFIATMQQSKAKDAPAPQGPGGPGKQGGAKRPIKLDSKAFDPNPTRT